MTICTHCNGSGKITTVHTWSDGLGSVVCECPLCDGTGELTESLEATVIQLKRELGEARHDLKQLQTDAALFWFELENNGQSIPVRGASRPGPNIGRERIRRIAQMMAV